MVINPGYRDNGVDVCLYIEGLEFKHPTIWSLSLRSLKLTTAEQWLQHTLLVIAPLLSCHIWSRNWWSWFSFYSVLRCAHGVVIVDGLVCLWPI